MEYCGKCYYGDITYAFGYCKECWIKAGKPTGMDGKTITTIRGEEE